MSVATTDSRAARARRRLSVLTALAVLTSVLVTATGATGAYANLSNGCPDDSTKGHFQREVRGFRFPDGHTHSVALLVFWIEGTATTFEPLRNVELDNRNGSITQSATFENNVSRSFSLTQSVSTGVELTLIKDVFTATVSASIAQTLTTTTGQSASITLTAPPFSRVSAVYGLDLVRVVWTVDIYQKDSRCWYHGSFRNVLSDDVPTITERWITSGP